MAINGIERIAERILQDAQTEAAGIRSAAEENCAKIDAQYDRQARDVSSQLQENAENEAAELVRRMKGEAEMAARSALLEEKQALMHKAFDAAQQQILNMDEEAYRTFLAGLACSASVSGKEMLMLSEKDLERFGRDLCKEINERLEQSGRVGGIILSPVPAEIEGGLLLKDGSIETNCSIATLIAGSRDALVPQVAAMLFGQEVNHGQNQR